MARKWGELIVRQQAFDFGITKQVHDMDSEYVHEPSSTKYEGGFWRETFQCPSAAFHFFQCDQAGFVVWPMLPNKALETIGVGRFVFIHKVVGCWTSQVADVSAFFVRPQASILALASWLAKDFGGSICADCQLWISERGVC
jgi:hypothetical protein